ncbi:MAG: type II toxin-antitoxin system RelE/ParE family toxin [Oscillospiraceae bacterium]|nr:type II toxin-antitoxin system RelE/ParE family toxin [Oscillospiraceae bacterium]
MNDPIILPGAARFLKKLKEKALKTKFQGVLDLICKNPYIGEAKTGDLSGIFCYDIFHANINYELAYTLIEQNGETIVVILAGTRENFYQELKRYIKNRN